METPWVYKTTRLLAKGGQWTKTVNNENVFYVVDNEILFTHKIDNEIVLLQV